MKKAEAEHTLPMTASGKPYHHRSGYKQGKGVVNRDPSLTQQDLSYTVRELLIKHSNSVLIGGTIPTYNDEEADFESIDQSKIEHLDLYDRETIIRNNLAKINQLKEQLNTEKQKSATAKIDDQIDTEINEQGGTTQEAKPVSKKESKKQAVTQTAD